MRFRILTAHGPFTCIFADLEAEDAAASNGIKSILQEELPDNLTFVIETGGALKWNMPEISAEYLQYWTITAGNGMQKVKELPQGNMGDKDTLKEFLAFCKEYFPADNTMLVIWDHGGGPQYGACWDPNFGCNCSLQVREVSQVIDEVYGTDYANPPMDILDYDCCMMSALDSAEAVRGQVRYLIASEENEPETGQDFQGYVRALRKEPHSTPLQFGKSVIENYQKLYSPNGEPCAETLTLVDVSMIEEVTKAFNAFAGDVIRSTYANPDFFIGCAMAAEDSNVYGFNSRTALVYSNLVDIGDLAERLEGKIASAPALLDAIDRAVKANFCGEYHEGSRGLSMYYSFNADQEGLGLYVERGTNTGAKAINELHVFGNFSPDSKEYVSSLGLNPEAPPSIGTFATLSTPVDTSVHRNSDGQYYVDFGPEVGKISTNVMQKIYRFDGNEIMVLGVDDEVETDWNEGIIINQFGGKWFTVGDFLVFADLAYDSDEYNIYSIPFKPVDHDENDFLNFLQVVYDAQNEQWYTIGAIGDSDAPGAMHCYGLDEGTPIRLFQAYAEVDENGDEYLDYREIGTVEYQEGNIHYNTLPDGEYGLVLMAEDIHRQRKNSDLVRFTVENGLLQYER